jgi:hypothetical protein
MLSIPSAATNTNLTHEQAHCAPLRQFAMLFEVPTLRPPVLEEMNDDLERLIAKVARQYTDQSCPELHYDDLVAEGRFKLAQTIDKQGFERAYTRSKFFAFFSVNLNHHICSLVQKYRFTEKRTGVKPPAKGEKFTGENRIKTAEVRLDDEEINLQVAALPCEAEKNHEVAELMEDWEQVLSVKEVTVFRQLTHPNVHALELAKLDARIGKKQGAKLNIKIKYEHLADGIGFTLQEFEEAVLRVREKILKYRAMTQTEEQARIQRSAAIAQLEVAFNLQIPKTIDDIIVRRLLTIAARDNYDKVKDSPDIQTWLEIAGAKLPKMQGDVLECRGVLHNKNSCICSSCGYKTACAAECANYGLGKITISPRLLGAKQIRVPAILPDDPNSAATPATNDETMEIVAYLEENFKKVVRKGHACYAHMEKLDNENFPRLLFQIDTNGAEFRLRFCKPGETLRKSLRYENKCYYVPSNLSVGETIALIDTHSKEAYAVN